MDAKQQDIKQGSVFERMSAVARVPGTPITIRFPPASDVASLGESPLAADGDARRAKLLVNDANLMSNLKATYEGFVDYKDADGTSTKVAYYCYVGMNNISVFRGRDPRGGLRSRLSKVFPDTTTRWEQIQCASQSGRADTWDRVRVTGEQDFWCDSAGNGGFRKFDGIIEFYCREVGDHWVVICWRVPVIYAPTIELTTWAPRVAGSVTIE